MIHERCDECGFDGAAAWTRGITLGDSRIDVRGMLEDALHDSLHHLRDVELGFVRLRA